MINLLSFSNNAFSLKLMIYKRESNILLEHIDYCFIYFLINHFNIENNTRM